MPSSAPWYYFVEDVYHSDLSTQIQTRGEQGYFLKGMFEDLNRIGRITLVWESTAIYELSSENYPAWPPTT